MVAACSRVRAEAERAKWGEEGGSGSCAFKKGEARGRKWRNVGVDDAGGCGFLSEREAVGGRRWS